MKRFAAAVLLVLTAAACREEPSDRPPAEDPAHRASIEQWQARRAERLKAEDGWLSLIGLFWLDEGQNVISIPSKSTPEPVKLVRTGTSVTLEATPAMTVGGKPASGAVALQDDHAESGPTVVQIGSVRFNVIRRGDRLGLRVKDAQARTRLEFAGLDYFPIDPKWRVEARLDPYNPPKNIPITDVTGMTSDNVSPGALVFSIDGKEYRIDPILEEGSDELFLIFKDETSKDDTYPAGRYLYAAKPGPDGRTTIDFNKAYNPPCTFTPFATCPLPPQQNRLEVRVEAGEKRYEGPHA
jgi:uncharacterized protein (DUF1684 family)